MNDPHNIRSVTGVDIELKIAGAGARSYAFLIDWHIRLIIALAWYIVGTVVVWGSLTPGEQSSAQFPLYLYAVLIPALVVYGLYHVVLEIVMRGSTPGKRIAGVRIVTQAGHTPGVFALLLRNVLRMFDSLPFGYAIGLTCAILTRQSVRIGDLAAGTVLVYQQSGSQALDVAQFANQDLDFAKVELVNELLDRWDELDPDKRRGLGQKLLVQMGRDGAEALDESTLKGELFELTGRRG
ncbi:MAG: RDD family protein [Pseudomonadota bacterium]